MSPSNEIPFIDTALFVIANLVNLLLAVLFVSRSMGQARAEHILGLVVVALVLPVSAVIIANVQQGRPWWTIVLPSFLVLYLVIELLLDYILRLDFRSTSVLYPYIVVYYLGLIGMLGYTFIVDRRYGAITLMTYGVNLIVTLVTYGRVGHG